MEGTDVAATTIHALFQLDGELHSKLDFSKLDDAKVTFLMQLEVLMLDEVRRLQTSRMLAHWWAASILVDCLHASRMLAY